MFGLLLKLRDPVVLIGDDHALQIGQKIGVSAHTLYLNMELYGGSVYSSLQHDFVTWMLSDATSTKLLNSLKHTACAEEVYFQTVLMNSPFKGKVIGKPLRYVDWSVIPAPKYLTEEDYTSIVESESLFCRKVDSRLSDRLVSRLEDYIASNKEN